MALARDLCPSSSWNALLHAGVTTKGVGQGVGVSRRLVQERDQGQMWQVLAKRRGFDSEDMFQEGDKAPPASSGNCFV